MPVPSSSPTSVPKTLKFYEKTISIFKVRGLGLKCWEISNYRGASGRAWVGFGWCSSGVCSGSTEWEFSKLGSSSLLRKW